MGSDLMEESNSYRFKILFQSVASKDGVCAWQAAMAASRWYSLKNSPLAEVFKYSFPLSIRGRFHNFLSWCLSKTIFPDESSRASAREAWKHIKAMRALVLGKSVNGFFVSSKQRRMASSHRSCRMS